MIEKKTTEEIRLDEMQDDKVWVSLEEHEKVVKGIFNSIRARFNSKKQLSSCDFGIMENQLDSLERECCGGLKP